jgi:hypothetical protein
MTAYITLPEAATRCSVSTKRIKNLLSEGCLQGTKKQRKSLYEWQLVEVASLDVYIAQRRQVPHIRRQKSLKAASAAREAVLEYCQEYLVTHSKHAAITDVVEHTGLTIHQVKHALAVLRRQGYLPRNHQRHRYMMESDQPDRCYRCGLIEESLSRGLCHYCCEETTSGKFYWYELNTEPASSWRAGVLAR